MENSQEIAARMLGTVAYSNGMCNLDNDFCEYLHKAEELIKQAGGQLISRQAIACLIVQWEGNNPCRSARLE